MPGERPAMRAAMRCQSLRTIKPATSVVGGGESTAWPFLSTSTIVFGARNQSWQSEASICNMPSLKAAPSIACSQ